MRAWFLFLGLLVAAAAAQDSLPWQGAVVFDDPVRVDDAPGLSGHPAIHPQTIMDSSWTLYSVWADDRDNDGQYEVFFAASFDTAQTWTADVNLSQDPSRYYVFPWLAVDHENLYVVWQAWRGNTWRILFTKSSNRGATWTAPVQAPGISVVNDFNSGINFGPQPKLAVDSRSNPDTTYIYLLWADNATGKIQMKLARSIDFGASFSDLGIVDKNPENVNRNPYIAVDDAGRVHCAWARGTGGTNQDPHPWIGYNRSTDRGETFLGTDIVVNDNVDGVYRGNPSMTCNAATGEVLVSWEDSRRASGNANPDIWFARIARDSLAAGSNQRVNWFAPDTSAKYDNYKPVVRMDPRGIMVAAWHDNPENASSYGIHLAAYNDTVQRFSASQSLYHTFTGTNSGSFGNNFYPPSLFVQFKVDSTDTITHFFIVWQDFSEDSVGGNIYSVHGRVVKILGDLDVDNDSLDVVADTMRVKPRLVSAGPPPLYTEYAFGAFVLANTSTAYNPDSGDGPSTSWIDSITFSGRLSGPRGVIDSILIPDLPTYLAQGQTVICTLAVFVPVGLPDGDYSGPITITGKDSLRAPVEETFYVLVKKLGDLDIDDDSLDVASDTVNLHTQPAGPVYHPYAKARFMLVNTDSFYNPDTLDGPSHSPLVVTGYDAYFSSAQDTIDSIYVFNLPTYLEVGQAVECTLALVIPVGTTIDQTWSGLVAVDAYDTAGYRVRDSLFLAVRGPVARQTLDSLRVAPIPFKPYTHPEHDAIHFQGLTDGARVIVYDASGQEVWRATEHGDGHLEWDAKVASGIYAYLVVTADGKASKVGKLSVIR